MIVAISDDAKAALLLCGRFFAPQPDDPKPLAPREFSNAANWLGRSSLGPSALFDDSVRNVFARETGIEESRIRALIDRGGALALAMERWSSRGIWVMTRLDRNYPKRLTERLRERAPVVLFGAGPKELLDGGGLAVVGSRSAEDDSLAFAREVGHRCAENGTQIVSGAARGTDEEVMLSVLQHGGRAVGVLADSLDRTAMSRKYRAAILEGRAALVSPFHPDAGFSVGNAMARNASIYALADAALVVASAMEEGGTWAGATDNLKRGNVPLFVRDVPLSGNQALLAAGAAPWPEDGPIEQVLHPMVLRQPVPAFVFDRPVPTTPDPGDLFAVVSPYILRALDRERTAKEVAEALGIEPAQARAWLKRLVAEKRIRKLSKPVRYVVVAKLF